MKSLSIVALTLLTAVNAANVTFKVIAPDAQKSVQVNINGQMTVLNAADADIPYFTGSADLAANGSYKVINIRLCIFIVILPYVLMRQSFIYRSMLLMVLLKTLLVL